MPQSNSGLVSRLLAVYAKDLRVELRTRYALSAILMFGITSLAVVSFSLGQAGLSPSVLAALLWIVMFFSATAGLAQAFVREEESGTGLTLRLKADPDAVYWGKLFYNVTLLVLMALIIVPLFFAFTDAASEQPTALVVLVALGVIGLCAAMTLVGAIVARAAFRGALFAVLAFPVLIPLLLGLISGTAKVLGGQGLAAAWAEVRFLLAYGVVMITGSVLLFRFVWKD